MPSPMGRGVFISKSTPLALTLLVNASNFFLPVEITTGKVRGNRTAARTSWLGKDESIIAADFIGPIHKIVISRLQTSAPARLY